MLSAQRIYIKLYSPPSLRIMFFSSAALRSAQHCIAQENAQHVPCDHTARSIAQCPVLHCIVNIVQRSVLAAVSPSQVKPSAAASGGTTRKTLQKVCALALHCAQRFTAATAYPVRSIEQCAALYSTPPPALYSAQHYTAPNTASQDKVDRSKRTKPVTQRGFVAFSLFD